MQISTNYLFERSTERMGLMQNDLAKSQAQIAARKQVLNPSDAPDQAAAIARLKSVIRRQDSYAVTINTTQARLEVESSVLESANSVLIRIKELAIQANSGTQSPISRQAIASEMKGLRNHLLSLANTQDTNGNYMFSGSQTHTEAFATQSDGSVVYQGDQTRMSVEVGEQRKITINRPGSDAFVRVLRGSGAEVSGVGFFQAIDDLTEAVWDETRAQVMSTADRNNLIRGLNEIDALHTGVILAQGDGGTNMQVLEQQSATLDSTKLSLQTALSDIEDLDYASAITKMQQQLLSLEAAQASFAKISQLSLFNYIK